MYAGGDTRLDQLAEPNLTDTKLADRACAAESKLRAIETATPAAGDTGTADLVAHLQSELATARSELAAAQATGTSSGARAASLASELESAREELAGERGQKETWARQATGLDRKLRDRNAEARESRKLVEQVQDEMIGLNLEKNMAEQRAEQLTRENKDLIERWVEYKSREAERMNEQSRW